MSEQASERTPGGCLLVAHVVCAVCESGVANPRYIRRPAAIVRAVRAPPRLGARFALQSAVCGSFAACRAGKVTHSFGRQLSTHCKPTLTVRYRPIPILRVDVLIHIRCRHLPFHLNRPHWSSKHPIANRSGPSGISSLLPRMRMRNADRTQRLLFVLCQLQMLYR